MVAGKHHRKDLGEEDQGLYTDDHHAAATTVQSVFRGKQARKNLHRGESSVNFGEEEQVPIPAEGKGRGAPRGNSDDHLPTKKDKKKKDKAGGQEKAKKPGNSMNRAETEAHWRGGSNVEPLLEAPKQEKMNDIAGKQGEAEKMRGEPWGTTMCQKCAPGAGNLDTCPMKCFASCYALTCGCCVYPHNDGAQAQVLAIRSVKKEVEVIFEHVKEMEGQYSQKQHKNGAMGSEVQEVEELVSLGVYSLPCSVDTKLKDFAGQETRWLHIGNYFDPHDPAYNMMVPVRQLRDQSTGKFIDDYEYVSRLISRDEGFGCVFEPLGSLFEHLCKGRCEYDPTTRSFTVNGVGTPFAIRRLKSGSQTPPGVNDFVLRLWGGEDVGPLRPVRVAPGLERAHDAIRTMALPVRFLTWPLEAFGAATRANVRSVGEDPNELYPRCIQPCTKDREGIQHAFACAAIGMVLYPLACCACFRPCHNGFANNVTQAAGDARGCGARIQRCVYTANGPVVSLLESSSNILDALACYGCLRKSLSHEAKGVGSKRRAAMEASAAAAEMGGEAMSATSSVASHASSVALEMGTAALEETKVVGKKALEGSKVVGKKALEGSKVVGAAALAGGAAAFEATAAVAGAAYAAYTGEGQAASIEMQDRGSRSGYPISTGVTNASSTDRRYDDDSLVADQTEGDHHKSSKGKKEKKHHKDHKEQKDHNHKHHKHHKREEQATEPSDM
jgi:hypothetical protein